MSTAQPTPDAEPRRLYANSEGATTAARPLTVEEIESTLRELPAHRRDVRRDLESTLRLVRRGITIRDNAPSWIRARNVVFVDEGELDDSTEVE
jgi:hypothetical protein